MTWARAIVAVRFLLAFIYLWVVADRLGLLGPAGNMGVVWGDFDTFLAYTASLNPWFPTSISHLLGYIATLAEIALAILLAMNIRLKETFLASFGLLTAFALSMIFSLGLGKAMDFIVFTVILALVCALMVWKLSQRST